MKRRRVCSSAVLLLLVSAATNASQVSVGQVTLMGHAGRDSAQGYNLQVSYGNEVPIGDAILIYAEPSHLLLVEHSFRAGVPAVSVPAKALARGTGSGLRFNYDLRLPYDPKILGDTGMSVVLLSHGREWLIASGRLQAAHFAFSTSFDVVYSPDNRPVAITSVQHCCGTEGSRCGRQCIDCPGAYFTCDRIACTIECGWN